LPLIDIEKTDVEKLDLAFDSSCTQLACFLRNI